MIGGDGWDRTGMTEVAGVADAPVHPRRLDARCMKQVSESPDPAVPVAAEGQRVAVDGPDHAHQAHQEDALHHHAQHVLLAHQPAVEQGQSGAGHHQHQRRGGQHPGVVALVHRAGGRRGRLGAGRLGRRGRSGRQPDHQGTQTDRPAQPHASLDLHGSDYLSLGKRMSGQGTVWSHLSNHYANLSTGPGGNAV